MIKIRLSWQDPVSGRQRQPLLNLPVALGSAFEQMPTQINGLAVSRMVIADNEVSGFQLLLIALADQLYAIDSPLSAGTFVNQALVRQRQLIRGGDRLRLGQVEIGLQILREPGSKQSFQTLIQPAHGQVSLGQASVGQVSSRWAPQPQAQVANGTASQGAGVGLPGKPQEEPTVQGNTANGNGAQFTSPPLESPPPVVLPLTLAPLPQGELLCPADEQAAVSQGCSRQVGFLFMRRCGRTTSEGCPHCRLQAWATAPRVERAYYEGFGRYQPGDWGYELLLKAHHQG